MDLPAGVNMTSTTGSILAHAASALGLDWNAIKIAKRKMEAPVDGMFDPYWDSGSESRAFSNQNK